ncbi:hypothetical protein Rhopal_006264-T1 [Rhodotorula paludigena]|uniref:BHLH domain-containing protein n=1 Tax=Rhodotorula paludigena TaxID=86838 RepID=A0AAV5GVZ8_9BASI|nr:hypothetical protein Rhopal_006264-T1 [Rhodotorula paludigena]
MAAFYGHPPQPASTAGDAPIKTHGFALPTQQPFLPNPSSSSPAASAPPGSAAAYIRTGFSPTLGQGHPFPFGQPGASGIDPAILLGLTGQAQPHAQHSPHAGFGSLGSMPFGSLGAGAGGAGASSLSDADLDFESVLASLGAASQQHQQQYNGGQPASQAGGGGAGAGANGFLGSPMFDQASALQPNQQLSPRLQLDRVPSYYTQHQQQQQEAFLPPAAPAASTSAGQSSAAAPGSSSKRSASTERTGRTGRPPVRTNASDRSSGVGKAPRQSRSRSARRSSSAAGYDRDRPSPSSRGAEGGKKDDAPSPAGAGGSTAASTPGGPGAHGSAAIVIPSSTETSSSAPAHALYAMSLPAFPTTSLGGTPSSLPIQQHHSGSWFPQQHHPQHLASAFAAPALHGFGIPGMLGGGGAGESDAATGWRPSSALEGGAGSAPPATGLSGRSPTAGGGVKARPSAVAKGAAGSADKPERATSAGRKSKGLADVQEEDLDGHRHAGKGDAVSEKRRKRRESHNAVERRRRDNINDRIAELATLLPEAFISAPGTVDPALALAGGLGTALGAVVEGVTAGSDSQGAEGAASPAIGTLSLMSPAPPAAAVLSGSPASAPGSGFAGEGGKQLSAQQQAALNKPNKGVVLAKSVDYIRFLQQIVELQQQQSTELQRQNAAMREALSSSSSSDSHALHNAFIPPQPPSFPPSSATSLSMSQSRTNSTNSPASPHTLAQQQQQQQHSSTLGLSLDSPAGGPGALFDFHARRSSADSGSGGALGLDLLGDDDEDGAESEHRLGGGRSARAGERAWTPMLEGIEGMKALKEEDMDET